MKLSPHPRLLVRPAFPLGHVVLAWFGSLFLLAALLVVSVGCKGKDTLPGRRTSSPAYDPQVKRYEAPRLEAPAAAAQQETAKEQAAQAAEAKAKPTPPPPPPPAPSANPHGTPAGDSEDTGRRGTRVQFGIMPGDYSDTESGVLVGDITPGTSADDAGIAPGDRLVTWNGKKIDDIHKWMEYLQASKVGEVVDVGLQREGKLVNKKVTLKARAEE